MAKTTVRTINEINQDYFRNCAAMGDLIHKAAKFTGELPYEGQIAEFHRKLKQIDGEADAYQAREERERQAKIDEAAKTKKTATNGAAIPPSLKPEETPAPEAARVVQ